VVAREGQAVCGVYSPRYSFSGRCGGERDEFHAGMAVSLGLLALLGIGLAASYVGGVMQTDRRDTQADDGLFLPCRHPQMI